MYLTKAWSSLRRLGLEEKASLGTDRRGTSVTPMPAATMCLIVSSEEPSKLLRMPSASLEKRANSGHTSSTWSRKQWPVPSSSMVSAFSSSAVIVLCAARPCVLGTAARKGSSYSGAIARPVSGKGSAMIAQSISPVRSISSRRTVKFSCSIKGICGVRAMAWRTRSGSR